MLTISRQRQAYGERNMKAKVILRQSRKQKRLQNRRQRVFLRDVMESCVEDMPYLRNVVNWQDKFTFFMRVEAMSHSRAICTE